MQQPYNEADLNRNRIFELALHHPLIANYVAIWRRGELTWEQVNYAIILARIERNTELMGDLMNLRDRVSPVAFLRAEDIDPARLSQIANLPPTKRVEGQ